MEHDPLYQYLVQHADFMRTFRKQASGWKYSSIEEYVAKNGKLYKSEPLTDEEFEHLCRVAGRNRFPIKQCFANSQRLVASDPTGQLQYVEGYASGIIPVHHGWVTINDKVIDLTMRVYEIIDNKIEKGVKLHRHKRYMDRVLGVLPAERSYIGVPFDTAKVVASIVKTEMYQSLIDNWQAGWPLIKGE